MRKIFPKNIPKKYSKKNILGPLFVPSFVALTSVSSLSQPRSPSSLGKFDHFARIDTGGQNTSVSMTGGLYIGLRVVWEHVCGIVRTAVPLPRPLIAPCSDSTETPEPPIVLHCGNPLLHIIRRPWVKRGQNGGSGGLAIGQ